MTKGNSAKELSDVMERYGQTVYGIALAKLSSCAEADDVYQDVFLLYYTKALCFENEAARRSWLIRTTINMCKKANRSPWYRSRSEDTDNLTDDTEPHTDAEKEVWNAVKGLKDKYRITVYLYYFENLPIADIAAVLKISQGAVQMRLVRARKLLKAKLKEGEYFNE